MTWNTVSTLPKPHRRLLVIISNTDGNQILDDILFCEHYEGSYHEEDNCFVMSSRGYECDVTIIRNVTHWMYLTDIETPVEINRNF